MDGTRPNPPRARVTTVEQLGTQRMPESERVLTPRGLFAISFASANSLATIVLGAIPVLLGLGFWAGVGAILLGVVLGSTIVCSMALFGPRNGTNNAVSSGAHFGVVGRIVGSCVALVTAVAFFCLSVWASGDAFVAIGNRLVGLPASDLVYGIAYLFFGVLVVTVCIYGFHFMYAVNRVAAPSVAALMLLGLIVLAPKIDPGYAGVFTDDAAQSTKDMFWPTFISSVLIAMAGPISYGAYLGDWSRYMPAAAPRLRVAGSVFLAQCTSAFTFLFGFVTASVVAVHAPQFFEGAAGDYVGGLVEVSPGWYLVPLLLVAIFGGMATSVASLYGTGLDFSSVLPRFSRVQATAIVGVLASAFLVIGRFVFDLVQSVSTLASLIVVCTTPWIVIMLIGYFTRRGWYRPEDLQVFNRRQRGGAYWFARGLNWRAVVAWVLATTVGLMLVNIPGQFVGPLSGAFESDLSLVAAMLIAGVTYFGLLLAFPEPAGVYGPEGPRLVRAADRPLAPVTPAVPDVGAPTVSAPPVPSPALAGSEVDG